MDDSDFDENDEEDMPPAVPLRKSGRQAPSAPLSAAEQAHCAVTTGFDDSDFDEVIIIAACDGYPGDCVDRSLCCVQSRLTCSTEVLTSDAANRSG